MMVAWLIIDLNPPIRGAAQYPNQLFLNKKKIG